MDCPMCGGEGTEMGSLGWRQHFRCRGCGMDYSVNMKPRSDEEIQADFQKARKEAHERYQEQLDREDSNENG